MGAVQLTGAQKLPGAEVEELCGRNPIPVIHLSTSRAILPRADVIGVIVFDPKRVSADMVRSRIPISNTTYTGERRIDPVAVKNTWAGW